jgi:hypothetical protein
MGLNEVAFVPLQPHNLKLTCSSHYRKTRAVINLRLHCDSSGISTRAKTSHCSHSPRRALAKPQNHTHAKNYSKNQIQTGQVHTHTQRVNNNLKFRLVIKDFHMHLKKMKISFAGEEFVGKRVFSCFCN